MSTLPSLTPQSTTVTMSLPKVYQVYPPRLPPATEIPTRINPLTPQPPVRRTVMLETDKPHFQNYQRSFRMKQREHYRYHNAWSKYYYGSPAEKEAHRAYHRAVLKQQMDDKIRSSQQHLKEKVRESEEAVERDMMARTEDVMDSQRKHQYLMTFRDDNKRLMEGNWMDHRRRRWEENVYDQEQLKYNPINWSGSLK